MVAEPPPRPARPTSGPSRRGARRLARGCCEPPFDRPPWARAAGARPGEERWGARARDGARRWGALARDGARRCGEAAREGALPCDRPWEALEPRRCARFCASASIGADHAARRRILEKTRARRVITCSFRRRLPPLRMHAPCQAPGDTRPKESSGLRCIAQHWCLKHGSPLSRLECVNRMISGPSRAELGWHLASKSVILRFVTGSRWGDDERDWQHGFL